MNEDETDDRDSELYQISILSTCDFFSSRRSVKQIQTRTENSYQSIESVYKTEFVSAMSVLIVDVFYFDFDEQKFESVEQRMKMMSFEEKKKIIDLSLCSLRFRKDVVQFKANMLERDKKFRELTNTADYSHLKYNDLSVEESHKQINSIVASIRR